MDGTLVTTAAANLGSNTFAMTMMSNRKTFIHVPPRFPVALGIVSKWNGFTGGGGGGGGDVR
jgi:hypothetical protein